MGASVSYEYISSLFYLCVEEGYFTGCGLTRLDDIVHRDLGVQTLTPLLIHSMILHFNTNVAYDSITKHILKQFLFLFTIKS